VLLDVGGGGSKGRGQRAERHRGSAAIPPDPQSREGAALDGAARQRPPALTVLPLPAICATTFWLP